MVDIIRSSCSSLLFLISVIILFNLQLIDSHINNNFATNRRPVINQLNALRKNITGYSGNIDFKYYNNKGAVSRIYTLDNEEKYDTDDCRPDQNYAIILHGWTESCEQPWIVDLIKNLIKYRGGCIICMDYSKYSGLEYLRLVRHFDAIANVLTTKLLIMEFQGFDSNKGYLFGFSYGGQLATEAGRRFGPLKLKEIDVCDMAGPGFDYKARQPDHKLAAQNVQCIHTSGDKGTRFSNCHQNWKMGNCGFHQIAAGPPPYGSHGLCPVFYNYAFENSFFAIRKPQECGSFRPALTYPSNFKMGYMETRKSEVMGDLFAITTSLPPFTFNIIHRFNLGNESISDDEENTTSFNYNEEDNTKIL